MNRQHFTPVEKVLMGKGQVQTMKPVFVARPWMGVLHVTVPFDAAQVEENKKLYPGLFGEEPPRRRKAS